MQRHPVTANTLGCWRFNQASGLYEPDVSGNAVNLADLDSDIGSVAIPGDIFGDGLNCRDVSYPGPTGSNPVGAGVDAEFNDERFSYTGVPSGLDGAAAITISCWFYITAANQWSTFGAPLCQIRDGAVYGPSLYLACFGTGLVNVGLSANIPTSGTVCNFHGVSYSGALAAGLYLATVAYDSVSGEGYIFINGAQTDTDTASGTVSASSGNLEVGGAARSTHVSVPGYLLDMIIDLEAHDLEWHQALYEGYNGPGTELTAVSFDYKPKRGLHRIGNDRRM